MADDLTVKPPPPIPEPAVKPPPPIPPEPAVQPPPPIPETPAGPILPQEKDPLFVALEREKKRTKRLRALLTKNKNLGTSSTGDGAGTPPGTDDGPGSKGSPAPILEPDGGKKTQQDPITRALNFLGKRGKKKRDGP